MGEKVELLCEVEPIEFSRIVKYLIATGWIPEPPSAWRHESDRCQWLSFDSIDRQSPTKELCRSACCLLGCTELETYHAVIKKLNDLEKVIGVTK